MLLHLAVRDLAIVDNLALDLAPGMTVLSGETGAGKSLLIDALELAVGERASADLVRDGAESAEVGAVFAPDEAAARWMREHSLDDEDGGCVVRRIVAADGRSRAFVNARPVPVGQLRALGERLLDVHGQHAHQSLLKPDAQRALLDEFAADEPALAAVREAHARLARIDAELATLGEADADTGRLDYLRFQLDELETQSVSPGEAEAVAAEHRRLAHAAELIAAAGSALASIEDEETGAGARIRDALRALEGAERIDPGLAATREALVQAQGVLDDAETAIRHYADALELDEQRLAALDRRLAVLHDLARKHRCEASELPERALRLRGEIDALAESGARIEALEDERAGALTDYHDAAAALSRVRADAAARLGDAASAVLRSLGMPEAQLRFSVRHDASATPSLHGLDRIALEAATNPGQIPMPLARIASGGELSRIALAIHGVVSAGAGVETLIFDEVDAGVGGGVAEIVGRRMRALAERHQVLTVTHLPQVAALAHQHVVVRKERTGGGAARTVLEVLDRERREREIARMLGGLEITDKSLAHAREMLDAAEQPAGGERAAAPGRRGARSPRRGTTA